jgi:hypothetical protein
MNNLIFQVSKDGKSCKVTGIAKSPYQVEYKTADGKPYLRKSLRAEFNCETIEIPQTYNNVPVTAIAKDAFANDVFTIDGKIYKSHTIKKVILPTGIKEIENFAFNECIDLQEIIIPNTTTKIGKGAFMNCASLKQIALPDNIKVIEDNTFTGCASLTKIELGKVTSIGNNAFSGVSNVPGATDRAKRTCVIIPACVEKIGQKAFGDYPDLQITVQGRKQKPAAWHEKWCFDSSYSNITGKATVKWS